MTSQTTKPNPLPSRKTKIVATVGPSTRTPEMIRELIIAGVNVFRLNFSHGTHEQHLELFKIIREQAKELDQQIAILQDLAGPKIRITPIKEEHATIYDMGTIRLRTAPRPGELSSADVIYVEELRPHTFLLPGQPILLADGVIMLEARSIEGEEVICEVIKGGRLRSRVGIAFPDSAIDLRATTSKDLEDVSWGIRHGVDYVAISFVQSADDVHNLREIIKKQGGHTRIISKIERKKALDHIDEIAAASDGIMVARGDLGLEVPLEKLPRLQKNLIDLGNANGIPVIVATQMLASMVTSVRPTRAEVTDVANAVTCGADAVMLSDETAIGEHPLESVRYLSAIAKEAERSLEFDPDSVQRRSCSVNPVPDAIAYAATAAAEKINAQAIIACTETGTSSRLLAKYRPNKPLFGASPKETSLRRMALYRGVIPVRVEAVLSHHQEVEGALEAIKESFQLDAGALAVVISGLSVSQPGSTSIVEIVSIK